MRKNEEIEKLEARVEYLERSFDNLTDTLIRIPIIKRGFPSAYQRFFHIDNSIARLKSIPKKIDLLLNHLGLEFEWVDCKPHYELKKKEDE